MMPSVGALMRYLASRVCVVCLGEGLGLLLLVTDVEDPRARLRQLVLSGHDVEVCLRHLLTVDGIVERVLAYGLRIDLERALLLVERVVCRLQGRLGHCDLRAGDLEVLLARLGAELLEHCLRGLCLRPELLRGRFLDRVVDLNERRPLRHRLPLGDENAQDRP